MNTSQDMREKYDELTEIRKKQKEEYDFLEKKIQESRLEFIRKFDGEEEYQRAKAHIEIDRLENEIINTHKQEAKTRMKEAIHNMDLPRKNRYDLINIFNYLIDGNWRKGCRWDDIESKGGD